MDYLVDEDGKLVTDDTVYVEIGASGNPNACVLSLCSENQELNDIIVAWGKTSAVFSSQEPGTADYTITIGDDFVNVIEETATPAIEDFTDTTLTIKTIGGTSVTLVGIRNITGQYGSGDEAKPGNVVVAYDAEGNNYLIKNKNTEMWSYGAFLVAMDKYENEQPVGAWVGNITTPAPTNNNSVAIEEPNDELATWLMNNGVSAKIFVHLP